MTLSKLNALGSQVAPDTEFPFWELTPLTTATPFWIASRKTPEESHGRPDAFDPLDT